MGYTVIIDSNKIHETQKKLVSKLKSVLTKERQGICLVYPGGHSSNRTVFYRKDPETIWYNVGEYNRRYINNFGVGDPETRDTTNINLEINIAMAYNKRVQGLFLEKDGEIFLGHAGGVGGGKKGVGKYAFLDSYSGMVEDIVFNKKPSRAIIIAKIDADDLADKIYDLLIEAKAFKERFKSSHIRKKKTLTPLPTEDELSQFNSEPEQRTPANTVPKTTEFSMLHGKVVNALYRKLGVVFDGTITNTRKVDLLLFEDCKTICIFEVKAVADLQSIYTAIGQLFFHGLKYPTAKKIAVLPGSTNDSVMRKLESLGIAVVTFYENVSSVSSEIEFNHLQTAIQN